MHTHELTISQKQHAIQDFVKIPGVGQAIANDLFNLGFRRLDDLKDQDPEWLYIQHNDQKGKVQDVCMLYVFRCAVYFAQTYGDIQDPVKLKWWNWKQGNKLTSEETDRKIRATISR